MTSSALYALSNADLPPMDEWQRAIDQLDLLFHVRLLSVEIGAERSCAIRFEDVPTRFTCVRTSPVALLGNREAAPRLVWSHAYCFVDLGRHMEATAATIACVSYAFAIGGTLVRGGLELKPSVSEARRELDFELAYDLKREDAYFNRYPAERAPQPSGPMELEILLHPRRK